MEAKAANTAPSAPTELPTDLPSAPPMTADVVETYQSNECVICLENKVSTNL